MGKQLTRSLPFCPGHFCTVMHSDPQVRFEKPLAKKKFRAYCLYQIEPGSVKNFAAQLKEGAIA